MKQEDIMRYAVFVRPEPGGGYSASVLGWSHCEGRGETESEAIEQARATLEDALATGKVVSIEIQSGIGVDRCNAVWWQSHIVGRLADDPTAAEWMEEMTKVRQEANQSEATK